MSLLLNILWIIFGGGFFAIFWLIAAVFMALTVIGLPWARACVMIAGYTLLPFGRQIVSREALTGEESLGTGPLGWLANIIWFVFAGLWLAIGHLAAAAALALSIVGIPFAWAHLKLAAASLFPVGKRVVDNDLAGAMARRDADARLSGFRP